MIVSKCDFKMLPETMGRLKYPWIGVFMGVKTVIICTMLNHKMLEEEIKTSV